MKRVAGVLFFSLLFVLCPIVGGSFHVASSVFSLTDAYAQEKKKVPPRHMTDFTAKPAVAKTKDKAKEEEPAAAETEEKVDQAADTAAAAAETPDKKDLYAYDKPTEEAPSYGWMIFKTILVLIIFGVGFYFFFKYISKKAGIPNVGRGVVQVLAISPIGQNKFIQIIDVAGRVMVIGVCDGSINLISELTERDEIDRIRLLSSKTTPVEAHGFQEFVSEQIGSIIGLIGKARASVEKKKKPRIYEEPEEFFDDHKVDYMREQRERLKKLNGFRDDNEK